MKLLIMFALMLLSFARANEACYSFYPDRTKSSFSINSPRVQIFRNHNLIFKVLKLSEIKMNDPEYQLAHQYLDELYPAALQRNETIKADIIKSNYKLWSQIHLILSYTSDNMEKPIAGAAFITSRVPGEKLSFESLLNIDHSKILDKKFISSSEVGRLSVDPESTIKRKALDAMLSTLYLMHQATPEIEEIYIFTARKLQQLYGIKGLHFDEIPSLSSPNYIHSSDVIAIFKNKTH